MNRIMMLAVALLLMVSFTKAQTTDVNNTTPGQTTNISKEPPFKVTKGYYSIYRNSEKLNHQPVTIVLNNNTANNYTKGFYAIGGKHTQLHKGGKSIIVKTPKRPVATKGYYSISPSEVSKPEENLMADAVDTVGTARDEN